MRCSLFIVLLFLYTGCGGRGYVPHYILTDSPETKEAMQKCQDKPSSTDSEEILEIPMIEASQ